MAPDEYKQMLLASAAKDIVYTPAISGVHANFLRASIVRAGADPDNLESSVKMHISAEGEAKAWKDVWSAGQGVGSIHDIPSIAELCARLIAEYRAAIAQFTTAGVARDRPTIMLR
jgi:nitronate monooxygenase